MKSVEEFDVLVSDKFSTIQKEEQRKEDEKARKEKEENEKFASTIIELLCLEMHNLSSYGRQEIIIKNKLLKQSDYVLGPLDKKESSFIVLDETGVTLHLRYAFEQKYNPFLSELDLEMINELLAPYYVTVSYDHGQEYECGEIIAFYDHVQKVKDHMQDIPEEEKGFTL